MTNLEWVRTLDAKELAELMNNEIQKVGAACTSSLEAIEVWLNGERIECSIEKCVFKNTNRCKACWGNTLTNIR